MAVVERELRDEHAVADLERPRGEQDDARQHVAERLLGGETDEAQPQILSAPCAGLRDPASTGGLLDYLERRVAVLERAASLLKSKPDEVAEKVERLLEKETLEKTEVEEILAEVAKQSPANPLERTKLRRQARDDADGAEEPKRRRIARPAPKPRLGEA